MEILNAIGFILGASLSLIYVFLMGYMFLYFIPKELIKKWSGLPSAFDKDSGQSW